MNRLAEVFAFLSDQYLTIAGLSGLGLLAGGLAMIYLPLALVVPGSLITVLAVTGAVRSGT